MKKRQIFTNIMDYDYYIEIISSKHSEIKEIGGENYKLIYDNDLKHKSNKAIEFL